MHYTNALVEFVYDEINHAKPLITLQDRTENLHEAFFFLSEGTGEFQSAPYTFRESIGEVRIRTEKFHIGTEKFHIAVRLLS